MSTSVVSSLRPSQLMVPAALIAVVLLMVVPLPPLLLDLLLSQRVEHRSLLRVGGGDFNHFALLTEADVGIVVEIDCPRCAPRDLASLKARLGEHQHLRRA